MVLLPRCDHCGTLYKSGLGTEQFRWVGVEMRRNGVSQESSHLLRGALEQCKEKMSQPSKGIRWKIEGQTMLEFSEGSN